jgi:hypothetical protein
MHRRRIIFLFVIFLTWANGRVAADESAPRYPSPSGKLEISFQKPPDYYPVEPDLSVVAGQTRHVRYQVAVYHAGSDTAIALAEYYDVYGLSETAKPSLPANLAKQLIWSPQENFVILPPERWPPDAISNIPHVTTGGAIQIGPHERQIVNLNNDYPWLVQPFPMDTASLIWQDPLHAVGQKPDACAPNVYVFDGYSGIFSALIPAASPEGYSIEKADSQRLLLRKTLGACATDTDKRNFQPECVEWNLSFGLKGIVKCP